MNDLIIHTIDLNFRNRPGTIGSYLIPYSAGCILVETGPGSTNNTLISGVEKLGYEIQDISDVFLTHIHLDHAGAAGWWANQGAKIHVHENGAPHLINPERLLASANRLYGAMMDTLWGKFLAVPEDHISIMHDQEIFHCGDLSILAVDVPGHANHHLAYIIEGACFTGDIAGIRLGERQFVRLPMPPPEFHIEKWRSSITRILQFSPDRIIPTHFGVYNDADWQLKAVLAELDAVETWMEEIIPLNLPKDDLYQQFNQFEQEQASRYGIDRATVDAQQIANPSFLSVDGILRYWNKNRKSE